MSNLVKYEQFRNIISNLISTSDLDIGMIYFIFKDIYRDIETLYYSQINKELPKE